MKQLIPATLLAVLLLIPVNLFAQDAAQGNQDWVFTVGAGAVFAPVYLGDDENQLSIVPDIRITYADTFFASLGQGLGVTLITTKNFKTGLIAHYDFGRDEDGDSPLGMGSGTDDLLGLGDVDGTIEVGAYAEYTMSPFTLAAELRKGLNGHEGWVGKASVEYGRQTAVFGQKVVYSLGPVVQYTGSHYNEAFFSVNSQQSAASGLSVYDAGDGTFSWGFTGRLVLPHTDHMSTVIAADYLKLGDTISESSLVSERGSDNQSTLGVFINYQF